MCSVRFETAMHDRRSDAPETFYVVAAPRGEADVGSGFGRVSHVEGRCCELSVIRSVRTTPRLTTSRTACLYTQHNRSSSFLSLHTRQPKPATENGHPLLLLRRPLPRYIHTDLPLSIHPQPTNRLRPPVSVLLINAIAVLSEDRFLARSTSPPSHPKSRALRNRTLSNPKNQHN